MSLYSGKLMAKLAWGSGGGVEGGMGITDGEMHEITLYSKSNGTGILQGLSALVSLRFFLTLSGICVLVTEKCL